MGSLSFLGRHNSEYIEELYQKYRQGEDLGEGWQYFFEGLEFAGTKGGIAASDSYERELGVARLIDYFRQHGHRHSNLDPLGLALRQEIPINRFKFTDADLSQSFGMLAINGLGSNLGEAVERLRLAYCGTVALDVEGASPEVQSWWYERFENRARDFRLTDEEKKAIHWDLVRTDALEKFLHSRFVGIKRFSIEGTDALIPMLERMIQTAAPLGVEQVVMGMAHRGRINVLAHFLEKPLAALLGEFDGKEFNEPDTTGGDVKYHMGFQKSRQSGSHSVKIRLAHNPSHLEAVNPVVCGMTWAIQRRLGKRNSALALLIHGDSAFASQGVVVETLQMANQEGYSVGGVIHVILDNQVGFTTSAEYTRSSLYPSDPMRVLRSPILHVNGDDPEACVWAMQEAVRFRDRFQQDVMIRLLGYRRHGHNEGDEPQFTQPVLYKKISQHPSPREVYAQKLAGQGTMTSQETVQAFTSRMDELSNILEQIRKAPKLDKPQYEDEAWKGLTIATGDDLFNESKTGVPFQNLKVIAETMTSAPPGFHLHSKLQRILNDRRRSITELRKVDWAMAELLAYGSLVQEGHSVRLSGEDSGRGTFSHRHSVFHDTETDQRHNALKGLASQKSEFLVYDSILSEMGVLGFEYGVATTDPEMLTIWEAQFGDFANGAQIIIDQFLTSGEIKWSRSNGLVLLLPHGMEGQGPEHSSARLERFLSLAAEDNIQVVNFTTPAQLFHGMRRQIHRKFRKPMIVMSPKSLLRHPKVVSLLEDLERGSFQEVLDDVRKYDPENIRRCVICSGKLFYDLDDARDKSESHEHTAILRLEQLYPFPKKALKKIMGRFLNLEELIWAQEEPENMGAYGFVSPLLKQLLDEMNLNQAQIKYIGRSRRASPATGSPARHKREQAKIIEMVLKRENG